MSHRSCCFAAVFVLPLIGWPTHVLAPLDTAKPEAVIVIRTGRADAPIPIRLNLEESIDGETTLGDIQLRSFDVVYVPKTWIANASLFVEQYISDLLLFKGWGIRNISIQ